MIRLKKIQLQNYMSYKDVELDLDTGRSYVVIGENKDNHLTKSNGSGKSALFESLIFCIYGKSLRGKNIDFHRKGDCCVKLLAEIDNKEVIVKRYYRHHKHKNKIFLYVNGEDHTAHTQKVTQDQIQRLFKLSFDHFVSSVVVAQGFQVRITTMKLSQFRIYFSEFIDYDYDYIINTCKAKMKELEIQISDFSEKIKRAEIEINAIKAKMEFKDTLVNTVDLPLLETKMNQLKFKYDEYTSEVEKIKPELRDYDSILSKYRNLKSQWMKIRQNPGVCPTCKRPFDTKELLFNIENKLVELKPKVVELEKLRQKVDELRGRIENLKGKINILSKEYKKAKDAERLRKLEFEKLESRLLELEEEFKRYNQEYTNITEQYEKYKQLLSLFQPSGEIRERVINHYLKIYYQIVRDIADAVGENLLKNIGSIEDIDYLSLSGGEKRRIDIIFHIALVSFVSRFSGVNYNLLVLDEITDSLDFQATINLIEFIKFYFSNKTLFVISHNEVLKDYFENKIFVVKQDGVSTLSKYSI